MIQGLDRDVCRAGYYSIDGETHGEEQGTCHGNRASRGICRFRSLVFDTSG